TYVDRHAGGNSMPVVDQQQNYKLLSLTESDGKTVMKFQRSIEACDENDLPITNLPMKLIYAYGQTDDITYHSNRRGTKELNLLKYMPRVNPPNSKYFDMTMVNFTVPANQTHYHCKIVRAPTFDRKQHIYRIEPVITNFDLVHHLLLYRCPPSVMEMFEAECYTSNRSNLCMETIAVWGVGGGAFEFPEVAGLPIGGNVGGFLYRLEVHYNNVNKSAGRVDNSGLRFYYTSDLRQHDAAVLMTGLAVAPGYAIPPKARSFLTYGLCDTAYIPEVLETPHDLQVFSVMLHTHLAGRKVRVGHFRGGKQIDFLAVDENYDFEYQDVMNLGKTKTVKLGDKLLVECTYNTENRSKLTWGGLSTSDEMCLAFLFYYPAMNLSGCMSFPNITTLISEMGTNWLNLMSNKIWNDTSINQYQQTLKRIEQHVIIADSFNNTSCNTGQIPDLSVIPSAPCISGCATKSLALLSLLLCLAVQFMQKYY
uniref:Monooxygenase, DBH-like 1, like n=1 Tax=Cyprinus carpio TaxID=7962 RepID=A0A8C1G460_CYPCA